MQTFFLGISKMLYSCIVKMLSDEGRVTNAIVTPLRTLKTFELVLEIMMEALNEFLRIVHGNNSRFTLRLISSKGNLQSRTAGFIKNHGTKGILETTDIEDKYYESSFLAAIVV